MDKIRNLALVQSDKFYAITISLTGVEITELQTDEIAERRHREEEGEGGGGSNNNTDVVVADDDDDGLRRLTLLYLSLFNPLLDAGHHVEWTSQSHRVQLDFAEHLLFRFSGRWTTKESTTSQYFYGYGKVGQRKQIISANTSLIIA